ncbi:hypothetical protein DFQ28_000320 [Apophysomyces sp. BC1034]|nr:hypothetical protein DFQ30_007548 [Apophysomyces sp. BC1015]KAG0180959.1 hypothetical protein DFQ29_009709 [Apophysomyces sp. BC1021]KAG0183993.1 hypothetical protein DFQ28_000320 [Apophysomyces sp. BC1034]
MQALKPRDAAEQSRPMTSEEWAKAYRKLFPTYKFYLDNVDDSRKKRLEGRLTLLGATIEPFFSAKCTHLVTTRPLQPLQENVPTDDIVKKAQNMGLKTWSLEKLVNIVQHLVEKPSTGRRPEPAAKQKELDRLLQDEKKYGVSTGRAAQRPHYVNFQGPYVMVEDMTGVHRPVVVRDYGRTAVDPSFAGGNHPWPYLKETPPGRSPFGPLAQGPKPPQSTKEIPQATLTNVNHIPQPPCADKENAPMAPLQQQDSASINLQASGYQQSTQTQTQISRFTSGSVVAQADGRRNPLGENVTRLQRRMFDNTLQNIQNKQILQPSAGKTGPRPDEKLRAIQKRTLHRVARDYELGYCENCKVRFKSMAEHIKEESHQTFIRDSNNFRELDNVLNTTRRQYKNPLPEFMKQSVHSNIDGMNVQFQTSNKRRREELEQTGENNKVPTSPVKHDSWEKYHHVFL